MIIEKRGLVYKEISIELAKKIILKNHYSRTWGVSFGKINIGVFKEDKILGVAVFGLLKSPKSYKKYSKEIEQDQILELNRMWLDDELGRNSESTLLSTSFKLIRNIDPNIKLINTFSDGRLGCGIVYQASNFKYYGKHSTPFIKIDGSDRIYHIQILTNTRESRFIKLNQAYCENKLTSFEVDTYNYIYALYPEWWDKISIPQQTPPKEYEKEQKPCAIRPSSTNQLIKALTVAKVRNDKEAFNIINNFLIEKRKLNPEEIKELIIKNLKDKRIFRLSVKRGKNSNE